MEKLFVEAQVDITDRMHNTIGGKMPILTNEYLKYDPQLPSILDASSACPRQKSINFIKVL